MGSGIRVFDEKNNIIFHSESRPIDVFCEVDTSKKSNINVPNAKSKRASFVVLKVKGVKEDTIDAYFDKGIDNLATITIEPNSLVFNKGGYNYQFEGVVVIND